MRTALPYPFNKGHALADSAALTLSFKDAAGVPRFAKRIRIVIGSPANYTGVVYMKQFNQRDPITADHVDNTCLPLFAGATELIEDVYCAQIEFLSVDGGAVGNTVNVEAWSDTDISGSDFA